MRLDELLGEEDLRTALEQLLKPETARPPKQKGTDAVKVSGYLVHSHWRRRGIRRNHNGNGSSGQ